MPDSQLHPKLIEQLNSLGLNPLELPDNVRSLLNQISSSYAGDEQIISQEKSEISERTSQLISSTSQAYSFLDTIDKGFIMCDTSGEIVLVNKSLKAILASTDKFTIDSNPTISELDEFFSPNLKLRHLVRLCADSKEPQERDNIDLGVKLVHIYVAPLLSDQELVGIVILVEDVTEQKMLDRSKDEFLSIASHELRTPLTAIRGNTSLIQKHYADKLDPDIVQMINDIHISSIRLIGIVNDFLDATAMEQAKINMKPEVFSPEEVIHEVVNELSELTASKGVRLVADPSVDAASQVLADRERIKQVFINLVGNAVKFTDQGSITISAQDKTGLVYFSVADTGTGMTEENQKLLFKKFQQAGSNQLTRSPTKGTGLGLYISKLIVELSGGRIWLEKSTPNEGSTFTFSLPKNKN